MNEELSGWKLVVGHVFREPVFLKPLCVMIGDQVQITGLALVTFVFAAPGFMSPASRGMLLTGMIILYLFPGNFSWCVGNNAFHYSEPVFLLSSISVGSDADMEDYGFEYSEEEPEEQDVDVENQYYNSKGLVEIDPEGAFAGFVEVVHMEPENAEWE
ncbi:hypothetical protein VitviT2T_011529 [Vitis vinifera]|uniref:Transmembrane 9 superfamily member n=1 Tax=Vitis vinifera TaxID=29760 RepID=A0ABY9CC13_VITVI|nr:hypothetical protein VitviT2T_011529 [Vitis vinifera]